MVEWKRLLKRIVPILSTYERRNGSQFHHSHNKSGGFTNSFAHSFFALSLGNCALKNSTLMSNNNNNNNKSDDDETLASSMKQSTQQKGKAKYKEIRPK
jgi:hypothetical protein